MAILANENASQEAIRICDQSPSYLRKEGLIEKDDITET